MVYLNLLPELKKQEIKKKILVEVINHVLELLLLIAVFTAILLLIAKLTLQNKFNEVTAQSTLITTSYASVNQDIIKINKDLRQMQALQKENVPWSDFFFHMSEAAPQKITLKNIVVDMAGEKATFTGFSQTRDALLLYLQNLEKTQLFTKIDSPLSNIFERSNINFSINAILDPEQIIRLHAPHCIIQDAAC